MYFVRKACEHTEQYTIMDSLNSVVRALTLGKALGLAGESLLLFIEHIEPLCEMDILKEENEAERQFEEYC